MSDNGNHHNHNDNDHPGAVAALRAELARSQQQVADLTAAQEEFLRAVSHDLRAPLRHVTSYGALVREVLIDLPPEVQQLADVLDVTPGAIRQQFKLLDGICSEAVALLADKPATYAMFRVLKQMKPFRQIDVAQAMVNLGNYSAKLALAMLQATSPDQLTEEASAKVQRGGPTEALQRLERELAAVQADTRLLEEGYGPANLQLEIIKTYIGKTLLENAAVVRWLAKTHSEYLQQLQFIAEIKQLPSQ